VDAGGVTFFEMNHHEKPDILSRLYFLKDRSLAMSYTHTNLFEDQGWGDRMKPDYPISASVRSYTHFIHQYREFLVFGHVMPLKNGYCANCMMMALGLPG
jgi:hypothetical protein